MSPTVRYPIPEVVANLDIARHHVIEASAGTGKTFVIEHRVVDLIVRGGAELADILVVTFTDKATAELLRRIRALISRVASARESFAAPDEPCWLIDDGARGRLEAALRNFDGAAINTIHGYCLRILADSAFSAGRLLEQTLVHDEAAFEEALIAEARERFARDPELSPWLEAFLAQKSWFSPMGTLRDILFDCEKSRAEIAPEWSESALIAAARAFREHADGADLPALLDALPKNSNSTLVRKLEKLVWQRDHPADIIGAIARAAGAKPAEFRAQLLRAEAAGAAVGGAALALFDVCPPFKAALAQRFLPHVRARALADKLASGTIAYSDMLAWVWAGLRGTDGPRLARKLAAQHRFALVDEFQDTDDLQWKIFRRLYLESETPAYLTVVGDPKQAIYSFRGADLGTYVIAVDHLAKAGAKVSHLSTCFRSTPALTDALNRLWLEPAPFFEGDVTYREVRSGNHVAAAGPDGKPLPAVTLCDGRGLPDIAEALDAFIPATISRLVEGGATVTTRGHKAPIRYRDIFILTRTGAEASAVTGALREAGVPCSLYRQEGLFQTDEAKEIADLLAGIADPHHRPVRLKAFATRFVNGDVAALFELRDAEPAHPAYAQLLEWHRIAQRRAYEELFARILADSRAIERELCLSPSERVVTNVRHIFELLLAEVATSRCDLWELSLRLRRWIAETETAPDDERDLQRLETSGDAVHVMTIHKSKGLEAAVVFLYGGLGRPKADSIKVITTGGRRVAHLGPLDKATKDATDDAARDEDRRLLYVALTRAKAALYLPVPDDAAAKGCYRQLTERLAALADNPTAGCARIDLGAATAPSCADVAVALADWQPPPDPLAESTGRHRLDDLRRRRRGPDITSYTRLKAQEEHAAAITEAFDRDEVPAARPEIRLPDGHLLPGAQTGIFLHAALEHVPRASLEAPDLASWCQRPDITALFAGLGRRHDIESRHLGHAKQLVYTALTTPVTLPDGQRIAGIGHAERELREVDFAFSIPGKAGLGYVRGVIDLVLSVDGRVYFLDWKSDLLASYAPADLAADVAARYQLQLEIYTLAVARMAGVHDNPAAFEERVGGGLYWFLRGAGDGESGVYTWRPRAADLARITAELAARQDR
ncbi:MAG TPA: UvrD-helicase domain-containing protein [Kofleriaceae bacterium]|nr:UvrD-helicase domain-containing protein [Kofleriaceae bacterium]